MSKLSVIDAKESKLSKQSITTKGSLLTKKSRCSGSLTSAYGSKFGRSVNKFPKPNDPGLVQTLSTENSRVIHTVFNLSLHLDSFPDLTQIPATDCVRELGKALNVLDYEFNYTSFWVLDILSKLIKDCQMKNFSTAEQNVLLAWFRFVLRCISINGISRENMFSILQGMFRLSFKKINEGNPIPLPEDIDEECNTRLVLNPSMDLNSVISLNQKTLSGSLVSGQSRRRLTSRKSTLRKSSKASTKTNKSLSRKSSKSRSESRSITDKVQQNLNVFYTIVEMIYQVFADRCMFYLINLAYSAPTMLIHKDINIQINDPKPPQPEPILPFLPPVSPKSTKQSKAGGKSKKAKNKRKEPRGSSKLSLDNGTNSENKAKIEEKLKINKTKQKDIQSPSKKNRKPGKSSILSEILSTKKDKVKKIEKDTDLQSERVEIDKQKKTEDKQLDIGEDNNQSKKTHEDKYAKTGKNKEKKKIKTSLTEENIITLDNKNRKVKREKNEKKGKSSFDIANKTPDKGGGDKVKRSLKNSKKGGKIKKSLSINTEENLRNSLKSNRTSIDVREAALQKLRKQFDRVADPELEQAQKIQSNNFILPLADAAGKSYVENILTALVPLEVKQEESKAFEENEIKVKNILNQPIHPSTKEKKKKSKIKKK